MYDAVDKTNKKFIRTIIIIQLKYLTKLVTGVFSWKK